MKYGYARVNTYSQKKDSNSLEGQKKLLLNEGCTEIFLDVCSGLKTDRPEFNKLLDFLKEGDTLGVKVHILNIGLMDTTPTGKLIRNIFLSFAEFERDMIVERTKEGKAIAKQREDFTEGRPQKYSNKQIKHAIDLKQSGMSYKQVTEVTGISKATLIRRMKEYQ